MEARYSPNSLERLSLFGGKTMGGPARMKLLYRGAEADIFQGDWCGLPAIYKVRSPLRYRLPELDKMIRGQRTVREAQMIHLSKQAGVPSPHLYYLSSPDALLVMEHLEGQRLKSLLLGADLKRSFVDDVGEEFGRSIGRLHAAGIMHGDLTTSNVIVGPGGVSLIDFGLAVHSKRLEDHAVDLRLIKETLVGAHNAISKEFMKRFLLGYASVLGKDRAELTVRKLAEIERRGRYARVE